MKDFSLIFKLILKNTYRGYGNMLGEKKKRALMFIVLLLGFAPLVGLICVTTYFLSSSFAKIGYHAEFLAVLIGSAQMITILFGIQSVLSYTFMSKDNEFLLQLPVKPVTLFFVKYAIIYMEELIISSAILIPCFITYIVAVSSVTALPFYFYLLIPVIILVTPVIPLFIVNLLAFPLILLINSLKNKSGVSLILTTVLYLAFMSAYFFAVPSMEKYFGNGGSVNLTDGMVNGITALANFLYFNKVLALAACGRNFFLNFGIFLLILVFSVALVGGLSVLLYRKSVLAQLEAAPTAGKKGLTVETESVNSALFRREVKNLFGNLNFAFNSIMGSLMTPLLIGFFGYMNATASVSAEDGAVQMTALGMEYMNIGYMLMMCLITLCGINYSAALAISREGSTFYINKYLPVEPMQIIKAKIKLSDIISLAGVALVFLVGLFITKIGFLNMLLASVAIAMFALSFNRLDIYRDLKKPNLIWNNANEVIKRNFYPMVPMFIGMFMGFAAMALFSSASQFEAVMGGTFVQIVLWGVVYAAAIVCAVIMSRLLRKNAVRLFDAINVD